MDIKYKKFSAEHVPYYYQWRNDPEVAIYDQSGFLRPMSYEEVEAWCQILIDGMTYIVEVDGKPVGQCAFMNMDQRNRHAELAIVIGDKNYWSQGIGSIVMVQLLEWGFEGLNLNRLYLHVFDFNKRAMGLYEKFGFTKEGTMRDMIYREGRYNDIHCYGLMRNEWKKEA